MGSKGSKALGAGTSYIHSSWYTGDKEGTVTVRSCRLKATLGLVGVHHGIVVDVPSMDKWVVYEWGDEGAAFYACPKLGGYICRTLGEHTLDEVYEAARDASNGKTYSSSYNCNHWTEAVAENLGYNIEVEWNCFCVRIGIK